MLVTNGEERAALAACRALHDHGYAVDAVAGRRLAATHWSRACERRLFAVDARSDRSAFADALAELLSERDYAVLLPGSDAALLAISEFRDRLEPRVRIGLPEHDAVMRCLTKGPLLKASRAAGIPAPNTEVCDSADEATRAARRFGFPVLIKPWASVNPDHGGLTQLATSLVPDESGLLGVVANCGTPVLVQRRVPSPVFSLAGVVAEGELLAAMFSRYARTWPAEAGSVSFSETMPVPPGLKRAGEAMLAKLGWQGMFEIELMRGEDGSYAAIDLNPRPYGSLELAARAGVPLAAIWCDWLLGRPLRAEEPRSGLSYRWEDAEARNLWCRVRSGRIGEAAAILRPRRHTAHAHFRLRDPAPLLARVLAGIRFGYSHSTRNAPGDGSAS